MAIFAVFKPQIRITAITKQFLARFGRFRTSRALTHGWPGFLELRSTISASFKPDDVCEIEKMIMVFNQATHLCTCDIWPLMGTGFGVAAVEETCLVSLPGACLINGLAATT